MEKARFICKECGYTHPQWLGKCPHCGNWGTFEKEWAPRTAPARPKASPEILNPSAEEEERRLRTSLEEFNRTLGGGIVEGSVILLGGPPGIGKSTLLLQVLDDLASQGIGVLYCSSEESPRQVKSKLRRLGAKARGFPGLCTPYLEDLLEEALRSKPKVLAVDSLQAIALSELESPPGSVVQVKTVASRLAQLAKAEDMAVILVGHVTKEGAIAGPKLVEHLVDVVLYFEHRQDNPFRILRAVKNRFGSTNEIGVFEMTPKGLREVKNPSSVFLSERPVEAPGTVVMPALEGTRPLLVEIQALVAPSYGSWRKTAMGIDYNRLLLLLGVIEKRVGLDLSHRDVYVNVVGGMRVFEPASDLAVVAAVISSHLDRPFPSDAVVFGEVGLTGEVRGVMYARERVEEARRLGFSRAVLPASNGREMPPDWEIIPVREVRQLLKVLEGRL